MHIQRKLIVPRNRSYIRKVKKWTAFITLQNELNPKIPLQKYDLYIHRQI